MELDEDEIEYDADKLNLNLEDEVEDGMEAGDDEDIVTALQPVGFELPPARLLTGEEEDLALQSTPVIIQAQSDVQPLSLDSLDLDDVSTALVRFSNSEAWVLLMIRMATRGPGSESPASAKARAATRHRLLGRKRSERKLWDYILQDFASQCVKPRVQSALLA